MGGRHLTSEEQIFVVTALACYDSPAEIRKNFSDEFEWEISNTQVSSYNPTLKSCSCSEELQELFYKVRDDFQRGLWDTGIVWRAYRLKRLDEMERKLRGMGAYMDAAQLLEQAAREVGGSFDKGSGMGLQQIQSMIDKLTEAVVQEVRDPDTLEAIEKRWGSLGQGQRPTNPEWGP